MSGTDSALRFDGVSLAGGPDYDSPLRDVSFDLPAGRLILLHANAVRRLPLADAAEGLLTAEQGAIACLGQPWSERSPDDAAACRARIGRTFTSGGWLSNLDVDENITLKQRHHTRQPEEDIQRAALELGRQFGFPALPATRPAWTDRTELHRAQWVRALLGAPDLLLLEFPEGGADDDLLAALKQAVRRRTDAGAAALWLTADPRVWTDGGLNPHGKYQILGDRWSPA